MEQEKLLHCDTVIAGGGIAGLVSALELLQVGQQVMVIDRDTPERLGGLARWAFGGMALTNTSQQKKMKIPDSSQTLLKDWHSFAEFTEQDIWPKAWAKEYAEHNHDKIYLWLKKIGLSFLPAVNWVERGLYQPGNSLPRYHVLWGTGWQLVETIIALLTPFIKSGALTIFHQHKVLSTLLENQHCIGVQVNDEVNDVNFYINANNTIIACGGINGSLEKVKEHWPYQGNQVSSKVLNGANPISDGKLHEHINAIGGNITHADKMWNYAAGIHHPQAEFKEHGLSLIPSKSAIWLNHLGKRIGPMPLVTGFDTHYLCQQVVQQEKPWTWQVLNEAMAKKELAVSGSLHNPSIKNKKLFSFLKEILLGNKRLIRQLSDESEDFICADSLSELTEKMNALTDDDYIKFDVIQDEIAHYDNELNKPTNLQNDEQIRRIMHARQWGPDKLRTCQPKPIVNNRNKQSLIAIRLHLISRKSLGGIQTNLKSQVLKENGEIMPNLYCIGEAAGFGGGGACGKRSLEGTFLSGCILTAKNAAQAIINNNDEN
ncbi:FAD-dependent oxidoreductase [Thalassotalea castellviae]|uniref:FAD-dependent oxidoreductase n=1 Tax=Thalassotalea castellviae TaxID=3075612 RepID=A0ABU2ZWD0_9GAMM|nr:FAD-dependent oxidoreductase [Thalassotalea sp. W431]MDT0602246.1 FAD-dependent oxidoreductase [Thalassotalea sp. W431]